jgi:hypothetical protein
VAFWLEYLFSFNRMKKSYAECVKVGLGI